jgi:hypothetical protein
MGAGRLGDSTSRRDGRWPTRIARMGAGRRRDAADRHGDARAADQQFTLGCCCRGEPESESGGSAVDTPVARVRQADSELACQ